MFTLIGIVLIIVGVVLVVLGIMLMVKRETKRQLPIKQSYDSSSDSSDSDATGSDLFSQTRVEDEHPDGVLVVSGSDCVPCSFEPSGNVYVVSPYSSNPIFNEAPVVEFVDLSNYDAPIVVSPSCEPNSTNAVLLNPVTIINS